MNVIIRTITILCIIFVQASIALPLQHFIIDTDMNIDDAMAILYLMQSPTVQIDAMTIAATGQAHCRPALKNLQNIMQLTKVNIPSACGPSLPLQFHHQFLKDYRRSADTLMNSARLLPQSQMVQPTSTALSLLKATLAKATMPIDILAIGPLTNLAILLRDAPALKVKIHQIIIMGGAINVWGNVNLAHNRYAEWNIYIDPLAAKIVFLSGIKILLIPLDLTNQMPIDAGFIAKLKQKHVTPAAAFLNQVMQMNKKDFLNQWYFWDPLAAVIATKQNMLTLKSQRLTVILKPAKLSGRLVPSSTGGLVDIATEFKKQDFETIFLKTLNTAKLYPT